MLYERVPEAWFEAFAAALRDCEAEDLELELVQPEDDSIDSMLAAVPEADVLVVGLTGQHRGVVRHVFEDAVRLKLVQKVGSRAAGIDLDAAREAGVPVSVVPAPAHVACAEHTLMLALAASRKLVAAHRAVTSPRGARPPAKDNGPAYNWTEMDGIGYLAGKTLGLIGMGDIAIEVAWRANAFDMDVLYYDEDHLSEDEAEELGVTFAKIDDLLIDSDIVSVHCALTPQTENLLDAEHLALMKPTAILVNTARGGIVDEGALARALREGKLAAAAIDAWATEPPSRLNPLLKLDNVVATPHVAAGTLPPAATFAAILPNILAALRGEPLAALLTPQAQPPAEPTPPEEEAKTQEVVLPEDMEDQPEHDEPEHQEEDDAEADEPSDQASRD
jgi:phosphoglycerate dehydrogenase-like enzyme